MIDLQGIDHIHLLVSDLEKSRRYYEKLFKAVFKPHPGDNAILMVESPYIHFFIKEINAPQDLLGYQHLSFKVPILDHVKMELERHSINY